MGIIEELFHVLKERGVGIESSWFKA